LSILVVSIDAKIGTGHEVYFRGKICFESTEGIIGGPTWSGRTYYTERTEKCFKRPYRHVYGDIWFFFDATGGWNH